MQLCRYRRRVSSIGSRWLVQPASLMLQWWKWSQWRKRRSLPQAMLLESGIAFDFNFGHFILTIHTQMGGDIAPIMGMMASIIQRSIDGIPALTLELTRGDDSSIITGDVHFNDLDASLKE